MNTPGENFRLLLTIHKTVEHVEKRMRRVSKRNRNAIQQEFSEWIIDREGDPDDLVWLDEYRIWH